MFYTVVDTRQVSLKFEEFPAQAHDLLKARITALTEELEARVLSAEPFVTGKLHQTTVEKVYSDNPERIAGYVRITADFGKAAALEYGSHRAITVNARSAGLRGRQGHISILAAFTRAGASVGAAFTRHTNIAAHRFLRGPAEEMQPEVLGELRAALEAALVQGV